jgi:D-alanine-D-alanine ligase
MPEARELVVLYGGPSAEHEVSCISAHLVASGARRGGWEVTLIGLTHDKRWVDMSGSLDDITDVDAFPSPDGAVVERPETELAHLNDGLPARAVLFPLLHGPFGEDGVIQGHFEALGLPYIGAGVLSSALCMDKATAKSVLRDHGLAVSPWMVLHRKDLSGDLLREAVQELGLPLFCKPSNLGSSIGVTKVMNIDGARAAAELAFEFDDVVILEQFMDGRELELALLGNEVIRVTAVGEIIASREFYDYEDKYELGVAKTIVPAQLTDSQLRRAQRLATDAFRALRVEGLARVDLFLRTDGTLVINEVNTMPGFTPISMYPMLWEHAGLPLPSLIDELAALALARHERRRGLRTHR